MVAGDSASLLGRAAAAGSGEQGAGPGAAPAGSRRGELPPELGCAGASGEWAVRGGGAAVRQRGLREGERVM